MAIGYTAPRFLRFQFPLVARFQFYRLCWVSIRGGSVRHFAIEGGFGVGFLIRWVRRPGAGSF